MQAFLFSEGSKWALLRIEARYAHQMPRFKLVLSLKCSNQFDVCILEFSPMMNMEKDQQHITISQI